MHTYIVYQNITSEEINNNYVYVGADTIVRKVMANSENEAIGKFIRQTYDIKVPNGRKLDPMCIPFNTLRTID